MACIAGSQVLVHSHDLYRFILQRDQLCHFLLLFSASLLNSSQPLKVRLCSPERKFFPKRVDPLKKGLLFWEVNRKSQKLSQFVKFEKKNDRKYAGIPIMFDGNNKDSYQPLYQSSLVSIFNVLFHIEISEKRR